MEFFFLLLPPHSSHCLLLMVSVFCWWFTEKQLFCQRNAFPKSEIPVLHLINLIQDPPIIKLTALFLSQISKVGAKEFLLTLVLLLSTFDIEFLAFNSPSDVELSGLRTVIVAILATWVCHEDACCQTATAAKFLRNHIYCSITKLRFSNGKSQCQDRCVFTFGPSQLLVRNFS